MAAGPEEEIGLLCLPDELLLTVASFTPAEDLLKLHCVSQRLRTLDTDLIWRNLCKKRWQDWPRYRLSPSRLEWLDNNVPSSDWKDRFLWAENDFSRITISQEELESLDWHFNFTIKAGGRGEETMVWCKFHRGFLLVPSYMPLPYQISEENSPTPCTRFRDTEPLRTSTQQWINISNFGPHNISRSTLDGEWIITNENVTIVSTAVKGASTHSSCILLGTE